MIDRQTEIDRIHRQIDKYNAQIKKVKSVVPLVIMVSLAAGIFFSQDIAKRTLVACIGIGSVLLYISTFVYAYFKSISSIKRLKEQLRQMN